MLRDGDLTLCAYNRGNGEGTVRTRIDRAVRCTPGDVLNRTGFHDTKTRPGWPGTACRSTARSCVMFGAFRTRSAGDWTGPRHRAPLQFSVTSASRDAGRRNANLCEFYGIMALLSNCAHRPECELLGE